METTIAEIPLPPEFVELYNAASAEEKQVILALFRLFILDITAPSQLSLRASVDDARREANTNGLT